MNNTPQWIKDHWQKYPAKKCERIDEGNCRGRLTKEHAIIFAGKQLQELWAILDICEFHHSVNLYQDTGDMNKEKHIWIALNRATDEELLRISKSTNYIQLRERLNKIYGNNTQRKPSIN